mgnify:CR=1 FL=1
MALNSFPMPGSLRLQRSITTTGWYDFGTPKLMADSTIDFVPAPLLESGGGTQV